MFKRKQVAMFVSALLVVAALTGCANKGDGNEAKGTDFAMPSEPITLNVVQVASSLTDAEFQQFYVDPIKAKYPNITLQFSRIAGGTTPMERLISSGETVDLFITGILNVYDLREAGLATDLNPLIKNTGYDLSKLDPSTISMIRKYGKNGETFAMPVSLSVATLFYNKDIFDMFAVPYPKDGMTWDEAIELTKKVTRQNGNVQYKGLGMFGLSRLGTIMQQLKFDENTGKAKLATDGWKKVVETYAAVNTIPGNQVTTPTKDFMGNTLAMWGAFSESIAKLEETNEKGASINWDIATFPTAPENKLVVDTPMQVLAVGSQSQHKEAVFEVIRFLTNKENELNASKGLRLPVLNDPEVKEAFGQNMPLLKGKNLSSLFKYTKKPVNLQSRYDDVIDKELNHVQDKVLQGTDINTALREAEENANKAIEQDSH